MSRQRDLQLAIGIPVLLWVVFILGTALYRGESVASSMFDPGIPMLFVMAVMIGWNVYRHRRTHHDD